MKSDHILVFGAGVLQKSLINCCKKLDLFVVLIDPNPEAEARDMGDAFVAVNGNDFNATCSVIEQYSITGIITAATDKPLVMMARIAEKYELPFFSVETAQNTTDKFKMKQLFQRSGLPCANGDMISSADEVSVFPVIVKPVDNSGSRGVFYCDNKAVLHDFIAQALSYSKAGQVLCEEVLEGPEYSVEAIHTNESTTIVQITQKSTTAFPYNVELGHTAPADISEDIELVIKRIIFKLAAAFNYKNCVSHTELKLTKDGVKIIETSPRLGGDFITSHLVPLSSNINLEEALINLALGKKAELAKPQKNPAGIFYFQFKMGKWTGSEQPDLFQFNGVKEFSFLLKPNQRINEIKNSLDRYGYIILAAETMEQVISEKNRIFKHLSNYVK